MRLADFARLSIPLTSLLIATSAWGDVNAAPLSRLTSTPYVGASIRYLVDGRLATPDDNTLMLSAPLPIRIGATMPVQYEFAFDDKVTVTRIRLYQHEPTRGRTPASRYAIELDTKGDGRYDRTAVSEQNGRGGVWAEYRLSPPIGAYRVRFRTLDYPAHISPNYGASAIGEFEIYVEQQPPRPAPVREAPLPPLLQESLGEPFKAVAASSLPWRSQFGRGLVGSMWLFWTPGKDYNEADNRHTMELLKRLHVNRYWLNPGAYVPSNRELPFLTLPKNPDYRYFVDRQFEDRRRSGTAEMRIVPFPSAVIPGYRENVLQRFAKQMHENNIGVIANEFLLPYGLGSWDFPRVMNGKEYPCVLSSSFVRDASTLLYMEFMRSGIDGLALGGDEFFVHNHTGLDEDASPVCRDAKGSPKPTCTPTCGQLFKNRFGLDYDPSAKRFSATTAKWKVFEYEELAALFAHYAHMMRAVNGEAIVTSMFRAGEENRPAYGVAFDVMGAMGEVAEMSSNPYWSDDSYLGHYYFANETKKLIAASLGRSAVVTLQPTPNFDRNGYASPLMLYGPALSALMNGARGINFYEQQYLFAGGRNDAGPWIEKFFNLTAVLEHKGLKDYQVPKTVAVLYSRASEDWWQLEHASDPVRAAEGILYQNALIEVLLRNAIPFDVYFLDEPAALDGLDKYPLAILPYPYSVSTAAADKIEQAANKGTRMLALRHTGEVDEFAQPHATPLLDRVSGVDRLSVDIEGSRYQEFADRVLPAVLSKLGRRRVLTMNSHARDVECSLLQDGDRYLVSCINWEREPAEVSLGLNVADSGYMASIITLDEERRASLNGRSTLTASDLATFRLSLAAGEAKILSVTPAPNRGPAH